MKKKPTRMVIYPKDVVNITGRRLRTARKLLQKVRRTFGKSPGDFVTVAEFCAVFGMDEALLMEFLVD